jgi:4-hydroxybenzoate polyprenyltransferase
MPAARESPRSESAHPPLYVDLEGALVKSNLLIECLLDSLRRPEFWWQLPSWLSRGYSYFKSQLARHATLDPALVPYNSELLAYLRSEHRRGRRVVLVSGLNRRLAEPIAAHLGCFDHVIAPDERRGMRSNAKVETITAHLAGKSFSYAGGHSSDLPIWRFAARGVIVNAPRLAAVVARTTPIEAILSERASTPWTLLKSLRPHQWVKNLLVFVPLIASGQFHDAGGWALSLLAFAAFCMTASAIYIINDLADLTADRQHPRKRTRPFASGDVSAGTGLILASALMLLGISSSVAAGALAFVLVYAFASLAYSMYLKKRPLVDVFGLSSLYIIRLLAGGEVSGHPVSHWLFGFAFFLFLSLALIKRVAELQESAVEAGKRVSRRGYYASDTLMLALMGVSSTFTSSLVLALYLQSAAQAVYASPTLLWPVVPLLLFWQCRLWLSTHRGYMLDDPIVYSAHDWVSWLVAAAVGVLIVLAHQSGLGFR